MNYRDALGDLFVKWLQSVFGRPPRNGPQESSAFAEFRDATVEAIKASVSEASQTTPASSLFGFALCTDDDVMTVFHAFATRDWVAAQAEKYPDIGYIAVEWTQAASDDHFYPLSLKLRAWEALDQRAPPNYDAGTIERFRALVDAMQICRAQGVFEPDTLLCVGSTDPGELMQKLGLEAATHLNTPEVAAAFHKVIDC